jgi:hypothetical protein
MARRWLQALPLVGNGVKAPVGWSRDGAGVSSRAPPVRSPAPPPIGLPDEKLSGNGARVSLASRSQLHERSNGEESSTWGFFRSSVGKDELHSH